MLKKRILASSMASVMALTSFSAVAFADDTAEKYGNKSVADLKAYIESDAIKQFVGSSDYNATQTTNFNNAYKYAQNVVTKNLTGEATAAYREMAAVAAKMHHYSAAELLELVEKTEKELGDSNKLAGGDGQDLIFEDAAYNNAKAKARTGRTVAENNANEFRRIDNAYEDLSAAYDNLLSKKLKVISKSEFKAEYDKVDSLIQNNKLKYDAWARVKISGSDISGYEGYTASYGVFFKHMTDVFNNITDTYKLFSAKKVDITTNADIRAAYAATQQAYAVLDAVINDSKSFIGETFAYESDVQGLIGKDGEFRTRLAYEFAAGSAAKAVPTLLTSAIAAAGNGDTSTTTTITKTTAYTVKKVVTDGADDDGKDYSAVSVTDATAADFGAAYGSSNVETVTTAGVDDASASDVAGVASIVKYYTDSGDKKIATYTLQQQATYSTTTSTSTVANLEFDKNAAFPSRDAEWAAVVNSATGVKGSEVNGVDGVWSVDMNNGKIGDAKLVIKFGVKAQVIYDANGLIKAFAAEGASPAVDTAKGEYIVPVGVGETFDLSNLADISADLIAVSGTDPIEANGVIDGIQTSDYHCDTNPLVFGHNHDGVVPGPIYSTSTSYTNTMGEAYDGTAANTKVDLDQILSIAQNYLNGKTATNASRGTDFLTKTIDTNGSYLTQLVKNPELAETDASGKRTNGIVTEEWTDIYNYLNYALNDRYGTPSTDAVLKTRGDVATLITWTKALEGKTYNVPMFTNQYKDAVAARQDAEKWYSQTNNYAYEDNNENGTWKADDAEFFTVASAPKVDLKTTGVNANTLYGNDASGLYHYYKVLNDINEKYSLSFGTIADLITSASAKYDETNNEALKDAIDLCAYRLSVVKSTQSGSDYNAFTNARLFQATNRINTDADTNSVSEFALVNAYNALKKIVDRQMGDVNGDGKVKADDAVLVLKHFADVEKLSAEDAAYADVDGDGKILAKDAVEILKIFAGL